MNKKRWTIIQIVTFLYIVSVVIGFSLFAERNYDATREVVLNYLWIGYIIIFSLFVAIFLFGLGYVVKHETKELNKTAVFTTFSMMTVLLFITLYMNR